MSVANDFDALLSGHLLKKRLERSAAMYFMMAHANTRYDPVIVDIFFRVKSSAHILREEALGDDQAGTEYPARAGRKRKRILKHLPFHALRPGMVLNQPISLSRDMLLLSGGYILTQNIIDQLLEIEKHREIPFPSVEVLV